MNIASSTRATENKTRSTGIVAKSFVFSNDLARLWDLLD